MKPILVYLRNKTLFRLFSTSKHIEIHENAIVKPIIPNEFNDLVAISVPRRPVFPGFYKTVSVRDPILSEKILESFKNGKPMLGVFLSKVESEGPLTSVDQICSVGSASQIVNIIPSPTNGITAIIYPHKRVRIQSDNFIESDNTLKVKAEALNDEPFEKNQVVSAITQEIFSVLSDIAKVNHFFREHITHHNVSSSIFEDPSKLADFIAVMCSGEPQELQEIMESLVIEEKLKKALVLLKKEQITARLQSSISRDVEQRLSQRQKEYFLHEQLKVIKRELGLESDVKEKLAISFREKLLKTAVPTHIMSVFDDELNKFQTLEPSSSEFSVSRNYLEWISSIPWGLLSTDEHSISKAREILDNEHYGMRKVKERILEFISIIRVKGEINGKIICLVGPPGVGKTSIASSIAKSMNRQYFRFSVGGLTDVAEIKGHRRTYIGSLPGKIVQALKQTHTINPVIVIDEIDKIGRGITGDPSSALLELFDPQQNSNFLDHYLDVPLDLSKAIFITTANSLDTIPPALLDRMEIIELSGYVLEEKLQIAKNYLLPQVLKEYGLIGNAPKISDETLCELINSYSRESGVRGLKKNIEALYRKYCLKMVENSIVNPEITKADLKEYIGLPSYSEVDYEFEAELPLGVSTGLAWTQYGGSTIRIESLLLKNLDKGLIVTGHLGKVMEESVKIAYSYIQSISKRRHLNGSIHVHVPEGATPKDGPSAGIAIASSLFSLFQNKAFPKDIAMTGELTITGKVLRVGGIREKIIAAKRSGIRRIVLPRSNENEFLELDDYIKDNIQVYFVSNFEEVVGICFANS